MALHRRFVIFLCAALCGLATGLLAAAKDKEEPAQVTAIWVDAKKPVGDLFINDAKGAPQKLQVGVASRGAPVLVPAGGHAVVVLRKSATPGTNGAATYEPAGEIAWPASGARKALLLLAAVNAPGGALAVRGVAISDDFSDFPLDSLRVANFLGVELIGRVGDAVKPVAPGASAAIPYPVQAKPDSKAVPNFPVGLARMTQAGKAEVLFNGRVDAWPFSRTLVLMLPGKTPEADPIVRLVVEIVPPPPPPKPKASP